MCYSVLCYGVGRYGEEYCYMVYGISLVSHGVVYVKVYSFLFVVKAYNSTNRRCVFEWHPMCVQMCVLGLGSGLKSTAPLRPTKPKTDGGMAVGLF